MISVVNNDQNGVSVSGRSTGDQVDKDQFLRLLTVQLQNQDPLKPQSQEESIGLLAQFSTLEQMTNIQTSLKEISQQNQWAPAVNMLGRTVIYTNAQGSDVVGSVAGAILNEGEAQLRIGKDLVSLKSVKAVVQ